MSGALGCSRELMGETYGPAAETSITVALAAARARRDEQIVVGIYAEAWSHRTRAVANAISSLRVRSLLDHRVAAPGTVRRGQGRPDVSKRAPGLTVVKARRNARR